MAKRGRKISVHPPPLASPSRVALRLKFRADLLVPVGALRHVRRELEYEKGAQPLLGSRVSTVKWNKC